MSGPVKVRYVNVTVDVQLSGPDTTVDQLLGRPGLKQSLHVDSDQPMGLVADRARTQLLPLDAPVAETTYVMVPVWRGEVEWQNAAGVKLNSAVLEYLPEQVPTAAELIDDLKQKFGIVTGHYALRATKEGLRATNEPTSQSNGLIPKGTILKSGRYILCPSVHYRLRFPNARLTSRRGELRQVSPVLNHVEVEAEAAEPSPEPSEEEPLSSESHLLLEHQMEIDSAAPLSSEQLTQQVPQIVTTFRFPALFPDDMNSEDQVMTAVQAMDTVQSRRITGDCIPAGDYVVLTVYKYVIAKPTRFESRLESRQVLFYLQPQMLDTLLSDVCPRVDKSQHMLSFNRCRPTGLVTQLQRCPSAVPVEASALVLEQVIPFTVMVPALNEKLSVPMAPENTVSDMLSDTNLLPLTQSSENPAQVFFSHSHKAPHLPLAQPKMVVLARGYDINTKMLIDILSPVTLAQEIGTTTLFAGWDYAMDLTVHGGAIPGGGNQVKHQIIKIPLSDSFDSVRKLGMSLLNNMPAHHADQEAEDGTQQIGLYAGVILPKEDDGKRLVEPSLKTPPLLEMSGPTVRGKRVNAWQELLHASKTKNRKPVRLDLWLEQLVQVEISVPGFSEPQTRWIPRSWTVQNILRLLHTMFEFEKRGLTSHQIAVLYATGSSNALLEFETVSSASASASHLTVVFEKALKLEGFSTHPTTVSAKLTVRDLLRLHASTLPSSSMNPRAGALSVCVRPKTLTEVKPLWQAKSASQALVEESSTLTPVVLEVSIGPGVCTTLVLPTGSHEVCLPADWSIQEVTRHAVSLMTLDSSTNNTNSDKNMCWSAFSCANPKKAPLAYTVQLKQVPDVEAGLGFEESKSVAVQTTYQGQGHLLLPLSEKASVQVVLDIAKKHYHLMHEQEFEVMGRVKPDDLLKQHASSTSGSLTQASFTLELLVRTRVVVYDEADHVMLNRTLSANGTVEAIHEAYRAEHKLHPSCTVQFFTKEQHALVELSRRHALFARPLVPEDHKHFKATSASLDMPSTIVELMAIHHEQKVRVPVFNLHGLGGQPKMINSRKFALAGEVAYAASIEYGHANGHSTWSLVPHLTTTVHHQKSSSVSLAPLSADKPVDPEQAWDLVETGATSARRFVALKLLPAQTELVVSSSTLLSALPGVDLRFEEVSLSANQVLQNPHATLGSVLPSKQGIVPLYVKSKPDWVITVMFNNGVHVVRLPVRSRVSELVSALAASADSVVTNVVTGKLAAHEEFLAHFAPNEFTFSVTDPHVLNGRVSVRCRGVSREVHVEETWKVCEVLAATLRAFDMPEAAEELENSDSDEAQHWGLFLPSGSHPLHPESRPNFNRETSFIIRRRKSKTQSQSHKTNSDNKRVKQQKQSALRTQQNKRKKGQQQRQQSESLLGRTNQTSMMMSASEDRHEGSSSQPQQANGNVFAVALVSTVVLAGAAVGLIL